MPNNFTTKSQEAIQLAQTIANDHGQQGIDPIHLLRALLQQDDSIVITILQKLGVNILKLNLWMVGMNDARSLLNSFFEYGIE